MGHQHDRVQLKAKNCNPESCFDLVGSRQRGVLLSLCSISLASLFYILSVFGCVIVFGLSMILESRQRNKEKGSPIKLHIESLIGRSNLNFWWPRQL